jgi:fumarate reductase subunit D
VSGDAVRADFRARNHPAWWAFLVHRVSGLLLSLFLPAHFWLLSQALGGEAALDGVLRWTEGPLVKFAEVGLVVLLSAHLTGGVRILMLEFLPWRDWQKSLAALALGLCLACGLAFALAL